VDIFDHIYTGGLFNETVDLNPHDPLLEFTSTYPPNLNYDPFLVKFGACDEGDLAGASIFRNVCAPYFWNVSGEIYDESGVYLGALESVGGCDSIVTLNLEFLELDNTVSTEGTTLTADIAGAIYQWVDCNADYEPIPGEIEQNFTVGSDGSYAVIVTVLECTDTSNCYDFLHFSIDENNAENFKIYPNPTAGEIHIMLNQIEAKTDVTIWSPTGQQIATYAFENQNELTIDFDAAPGLYIAQIITGNEMPVLLQFVNK
jgi:hypothetical protein